MQADDKDIRPWQHFVRPVKPPPRMVVFRAEHGSARPQPRYVVRLAVQVICNGVEVRVGLPVFVRPVPLVVAVTFQGKDVVAAQKVFENAYER